MEILVGILCGLVLSLFFSFGPAFFGLMQNSIHYGYRRGAAFEIGVNSSDIIIVGLMLTLLKNVDMATVVRNPWVASIGGAVVIMLGIMSLRRKPVKRDGKMLVSGTVPRIRQLMMQGFALNFCNPTVWIYWITIITFISGEMGLTLGERYAFFISLLLTELGVGLLKCRLASLLQSVLSDKVMNLVNKVVGMVLIGVGIFLITSMIVYRLHPDLQKKEAAEGATHIIQKFHHFSHDSLLSAADTCAVGTLHEADSAADGADTLQ